jgi:GT2 family glycosyltransferase
MTSVGAGTCPTIEPVPAGVDRPLWSVMIPTYRTNDLLEETLRSVLDQDPGPDRMQIAVVDDQSPDDRHLQVVRRLAPSRVEIHTQPVNVGLARNWNGAIERSRGHWVHILHQDDLIGPGFYERLARATAEAPGVGAAFCRHRFIDGDGRAMGESALESPAAGVLERWLEKISSSQRIQCPSIIVRRDVYEHLGGFRTNLYYALDWEMWVRIATTYPVWYEPETLASYRIHNANESARLHRDGLDITDIRAAARIVNAYLPAELRGTAAREIFADFRDRAVGEASGLMHGGDWRAGMTRMRQACECDPSLRSSRTMRAYRRWAAKLWLRGLLSLGQRRAGRPPG